MGCWLSRQADEKEEKQLVAQTALQTRILKNSPLVFFGILAISGETCFVVDEGKGFFVFLVFFAS